MGATLVSRPPLAARVTRRLARCHALSPHPPHPDTTVDLVVRRRQHAPSHDEVNTPERKNRVFAFRVGWLWPMLPRPLRRSARGIARDTTSAGGERGSVFNWCLLVVSTPPPTLNTKSLFFAQHRREVILNHPPATEELRPRHRAGYYQRGGGARLVF